jgi:hypothetical protein
MRLDTDSLMFMRKWFFETSELRLMDGPLISNDQHDGYRDPAPRWCLGIVRDTVRLLMTGQRRSVCAVAMHYAAAR